uniref:UDENN domain-containing protein n=1 Tax=Macrostomum lignano TaxID=282301 RepID=A0A1I8F591_9PLAT
CLPACIHITLIDSLKAPQAQSAALEQVRKPSAQPAEQSPAEADVPSPLSRPNETKSPSRHLALQKYLFLEDIVHHDVRLSVFPLDLRVFESTRFSHDEPVTPRDRPRATGKGIVILAQAMESAFGDIFRAMQEEERQITFRPRLAAVGLCGLLGRRGSEATVPGLTASSTVPLRWLLPDRPPACKIRDSGQRAARTAQLKEPLLNADRLKQDYSRIQEWPFNSDTKLMTTCQQTVFFVKGAPDRLVSRPATSYWNERGQLERHRQPISGEQLDQMQPDDPRIPETRIFYRTSLGTRTKLCGLSSDSPATSTMTFHYCFVLSTCSTLCPTVQKIKEHLPTIVCSRNGLCIAVAVPHRQLLVIYVPPFRRNLQTEAL